jgi:Rhodopirellula transposase DDE domain
MGEGITKGSFSRSPKTFYKATALLDALWASNRERFSRIQTLLINQDNSPENHSRRTQFMKRMVEFSNTHKLNLQLAYHPPYQSKYNPIERVWRVLEHYWNGDILDEIETTGSLPIQAIIWANFLLSRWSHRFIRLV